MQRFPGRRSLEGAPPYCIETGRSLLPRGIEGAPIDTSLFYPIAGETRSHARVASEGPRVPVTGGFLHVRGGQALLGP